MHHAHKVCVCVDLHVIWHTYVSPKSFNKPEIELIQTGNRIYFRITNFLGQSGSGKTTMVQKLLQTNFFKENL